VGIVVDGGCDIILVVRLVDDKSGVRSIGRRSVDVSRQFDAI
jgi:hypothetical protein